MRFCELSISEDVRNPVHGSVFGWNGYEHLVRVGQYRAVGPHANQEWIFQGDEIVRVMRTSKERTWR
jgi:hypothetical protein